MSQWEQERRAAIAVLSKSRRAKIIIYGDELVDLAQKLSDAYDHEASTVDLASTLYDLRCMAIQLLDKIEGGEE
jgi:hypothetical protein